MAFWARPVALRLGRSANSPWWLTALAIIAFVGCIRPVATLGISEHLDYNEAWNVFHATVAWSGKNPYLDAGAPYFDNYPPLSFYIVGLVGHLLSSDILAGRILSLCSCAAIAIGVGGAVRSMGCTRTEAVFSAALFLASITLFNTYVGMDDPQLLGQAVAIAGFNLIIRDPKSSRLMFFGSLLLTTALFIKHNLIAQPIALLFWLLLFDRRAMWRFALQGLLFGMLGLAACAMALISATALVSTVVAWVIAAVAASTRS